MELDAFQKEDEGLSGVPEFVWSILVRGHL